MRFVHNAQAPRRAVNLSLNEDLVRQARGLAGNLSERVEILLAAWLADEVAKRQAADLTLDRALDAWNRFEDQTGSFADEHSTL